MSCRLRKGSVSSRKKRHCDEGLFFITILRHVYLCALATTLDIANIGVTLALAVNAAEALLCNVPARRLPLLAGDPRVAVGLCAPSRHCIVCCATPLGSVSTMAWGSAKCIESRAYLKVGIVVGLARVGGDAPVVCLAVVTVAVGVEVRRSESAEKEDAEDLGKHFDGFGAYL